MQAVALNAKGLSKRFGESVALADVDLTLGARQVVGLVGENGAGKSTLLNILSGLLRPDRGAVDLPGRGPAPHTYAEAQHLGIARVFQEQALIGALPVYENLLLGVEARFTRFGQLLDKRAMVAKAQAMVDEANASIDVRRTTDDLSFSTRQLIEIIRACLAPTMLYGQSAPIVLLDEPTASLERGDEATFFDLVARIRQEGSLLFVSHRLTEVLSLCDDIVVLKDGRFVTRVAPSDVDERGLHRLMVGRERDSDYYHEDRQRPADADAGAAPAFAARNFRREGAYEDVSLTVAPGEVLGIGGLLESGKSAFGKGLAGIEAPQAGEISIKGDPWRAPVAGALIAEGVGYVPAERLAEGMIADQSVAWNMVLPSADLFSNRLGWWRQRKETAVTEAMITRLGIKAPGPKARSSRLSGGNQQKVVLARWLARDLSVLILDNPTRGVDAGAKEEIYRLIRDLTDEGVAIVLITDELLELIGLSNRIAIMRHGRIETMIEAPPEDKPTEQALVTAMLAGALPTGVAA
ncbi:MAG: sugar ABC transporter ATP-binding protein [Pseudomonadota bacterium]